MFRSVFLFNPKSRAADTSKIQVHVISMTVQGDYSPRGRAATAPLHLQETEERMCKHAAQKGVKDVKV